MELIDTVVHTQQLSNGEKSIDWVLCLLGLNVFLTLLFNFLNIYLQKRLKEQDAINDRKRIISNTSIEVESKIYKSINEWSNFQKSEAHEFLDAIVDLQSYINDNNLYIRRKLLKCIDEIIDYYSGVCTDYKKKDPNVERKLLDKYKKAFHE